MNGFRKPNRRWSDALSDNWENETDREERGEKHENRNFDPDGVLGSETRISDIRENWRLRVMRENEEREFRTTKKKTEETKKKPEETPPEPVPSRKASREQDRDFCSSEWKYHTGKNQENDSDPREPLGEDRGEKGSLSDVYERNWGGKS